MLPERPASREGRRVSYEHYLVIVSCCRPAFRLARTPGFEDSDFCGQVIQL
jgi:hypothetical protein